MESKSLLWTITTSGNTNQERTDWYKWNVDWWSTRTSGSVAWRYVLNESKIAIVDCTKKAYNFVVWIFELFNQPKNKQGYLNLKTAYEMLNEIQQS